MANRSDCKSFVRAEPIFHSKFCIKTHPHHTKLLCSWGGKGGGAGGGGGGGGTGYATIPGYASFAGEGVGFANGGAMGASIFSPSSPLTMTHEHMHHEPNHQVPGPIVGTGVTGLIAAAIVLVALAKRRKARA